MKTPTDYPQDIFEYHKPKEYCIDLEPYLSRFTKENLKPKLKYKILASAGPGGGHNGFGDKIWSDAPFLFILTTYVRRNWWLPWKTQECALACIGFEVKEKSVSIMQIQGVKKVNDLLKTLKWERALIAMVVDWARAHAFEKVYISKAEKNYWWGSQNSDGKQRLKMHYDVAAKRSGFKLDPYKDCYVMNLAPA